MKVKQAITNLVVTATITATLLATPLHVQAASNMTAFDKNPTTITQMVEKEKPAIAMTIDGVEQKFIKNGPIIKDGRTLVPLETFAMMGWQTDFLTQNNAARIFKDGKTIFAPVDKDVVMISDKTGNKLSAPMAANTQIINGETFIPMAAINETGAKAGWDGMNRTVNIFSENLANSKIAPPGEGPVSPERVVSAVAMANITNKTEAKTEINLPGNTKAAAMQREVTVKIDGKAVTFPDQKPVIVDSRTLVPIRGVFEALDFEVEWHERDRMVTLKRDSVEVFIIIGDNSFSYWDFSTDATGWQKIPLDVPAQIINDRTMLPVRFIAEATGYEVEWQADTYSVLIYSPNKKPTETPAPEAPAPAVHVPPKMESGTVIPGTTTPWQEAKIDKTFNDRYTLSSLEIQYGESHGVKLKQVYEYSPDWSNPYLLRSYTREGYKFPDKIPLYQEGKHNEIGIGNYAGVYLNGYLIYCGMPGDDLIKIFGEPILKTGSDRTLGSSWYFEGGEEFPNIRLGRATDGKYYVCNFTYYPDSFTHLNKIEAYGTTTKNFTLKTTEIYGIKIIDPTRTAEQLGEQIKALRDVDVDGGGFGAPMAELITPEMQKEYTRLDEFGFDTGAPTGYYSPWWFRNQLNNDIYADDAAASIGPARYDPGLGRTVFSFSFKMNGGFEFGMNESLMNGTISYPSN